MPPSGLFTLVRPCHLYIKRVWLWWGGQVWTVKILSMDTLKLMPIGQPPSPFETGSVCSQAGLELSILLPQLACPLPPLLFCVYVYMDTMCGWVGGGIHDACHSLRVEVGEHHWSQFSPPTFMCVLRVRFKSPDLHSRHLYQSKHLIGLASSWIQRLWVCAARSGLTGSFLFEEKERKTIWSTDSWR